MSTSAQVPDPKTWTTGNDAPTDKQKGFLQTLANDKNVNINPDSLNKSEASQEIDRLKNMDTTGTSNSSSTGASNATGQNAVAKDDSNAASAGANASAGNASKPVQDPSTWTTGNDPATDKQAGYIAAMANRAGEQVETQGMGKSEASKKIEELKEKTGM